MTTPTVADVASPVAIRSNALAVASGIVVAAVLSWCDRVVVAPVLPGASTRLPVLDRLAHPVLVAVLATVLLLAVAPRRPATRPRRIVRGVTTLALVTAAAGAGTVAVHEFTGDWSLRPETTATSPDGRWEVAVYSGADLIDPLWSIRVRSTGSPLSRESTVGCLDGDVHDDSLTGTRWSTAGELVVETAGHPPVRVTVGGDGAVDAGLPAFLRCSD